LKPVDGINSFLETGWLSDIAGQKNDSSLQHGGISDIETVPLPCQDSSGFFPFFSALFAERHIRPAGEAIVLIPDTFSMPE